MVLEELKNNKYTKFFPIVLGQHFSSHLACEALFMCENSCIWQLTICKEAERSDSHFNTWMQRFEASEECFVRNNSEEPDIGYVFEEHVLS